MLNLSGRGFDAENIESLVEVLKGYPDVENLNLYSNNIDGKALNLLIAPLLELSKLTKLNLSYNDLGDDDIEILVPIVKRGTLKHLVLTMNTGITQKSLALINSWRGDGLIVDTYHTPISPERIKDNTEEIQRCEFSM